MRIMGVEGHDGFAVPSRIVLARERPFRLGALQVEPVTRQVRSGDRRETLEPRVMQVLIALARAGGEAVTRDDLIEWCWSGRVVSDDSINRVLSRIRRLATGLGGGSFIVETIPRVGYRLIGGDAALADSRSGDAGASGRPGFSRREAVITVAAAATVSIGAGVAILRRPSRDPIPAEARQLFERAQAMRSAATAATSDLVIPYLQEAVRIAPQFGEAWGFLALAYRARLLDTPAERRELEPRINEAVAKARQFAPGSADAEAAALLREWHYGRWSQMEPVYRRLIERHPDHVLGYNLLGQFLMDVGRWSDSLAPLRTARRLDPSAPVLSYKLIVALWGAGRISEAEDEIAAAIPRWPRHGAIWQTRIKLLALTGRPKQALALLDDVSARPPDEDGLFSTSVRPVVVALLSGRTEDRSAALAAIEGDGAILARAMYGAALGYVPLALDMLEGIFLKRGRWARDDRWADDATHPLFQPHARPLWSEPRFKQLIADVGLEQYWRDSGTQPDYRRFA